MLRIVFMGSPDFSVPALKGLMQEGHDICMVYSQPSRAAGRGKQPRPTPVHRFAIDHGLPVRTPASLKEQSEQEQFAALSADLAVVVAYGLILPKAVLEAPRQGCFNIHASLLPRWRGAAPLQRAIMAGDRETGVCIMRMDEGLDTGDVCLKRALPIGENTTAGKLHDDLSALGAGMIAEALALLEQGRLMCTPQPRDGVSYAQKISKTEAHLDFTLPAKSLLGQIHGLSPFPGAWCTLEVDGKKMRLKLLEAGLSQGSGRPGEILDENLTIACADGAIRPFKLQREGKAAMDLTAFLRGVTPPVGTLCG